MTHFQIDTVSDKELPSALHKLGPQGSIIRDRISNSILYLILSANVLQYSFWGMQNPAYGILRDIIIGLVVILFLVTVRPLETQQALIKVKLLRLWLYCVLLFGIGTLTAYAFGATLSFGTLRDVAITLGILLIGYHKQIDSTFFARFTMLYIVLGAVSAYSYVAVFGFEIHDQYIVDYKNQIAPLFAILALLAVSHSIYIKRGKLLMILSALLLITIIGILRARTALVALLFCVMLYLFSSRKISIWIKVLVTCVVVAFIASNTELISEIFIAGKQGTDLNTISSGRVSRISDGLDFLSRGNNLLVGSLWGEQYDGGIVHLFLINLWIEYGGILSLPIILLYVVFLGKVVARCLKRKERLENRYDVVPFLMLFLLIVSFNEYSYPFSPISSLFLAYLLYGAYLRQLQSLV